MRHTTRSQQQITHTCLSFLHNHQVGGCDVAAVAHDAVANQLKYPEHQWASASTRGPVAPESRREFGPLKAKERSSVVMDTAAVDQ
jgi:hypothetical protein